MSSRRRVVAALPVLPVLIAAAVVVVGTSLTAPAQAIRPDLPHVAARAASPKPLDGIRIAIDPGHQLGNRRHPAAINRLVPAGGFVKACNTTGTATASGYPEATFTFAVARVLTKRLRALGAEVVLTRNANSDRLWGPCVDRRGRFGAAVGADLTVSLHADGALGSGRGFHVIAPPLVDSDPASKASTQLAKDLRRSLLASGLAPSTYLAGHGLVHRRDLATLNLSTVPVALVELGNMRNRADARRMESKAGRSGYAAALVAGIRDYLGR